MATHLAAWSQSVDQATIAAINNVNPDDVLARFSATDYTVAPNLNYIHWAMATGPNLTRAQIVSPSLGKRRINLEIAPKVAASNLLTLTAPEIYKPYRPIPLDISEGVQAQTAEGGAGATRQNVLIQFGPKELPPIPEGDIRVIRATGTTTLTTFTWTSVTITPDTTVEAGTYQLIGFVPISANCIAARALIFNQFPRPGMPGLAGTEAAASDFEAGLFNQLMYYSMGSFTHIALPTFQFFASVADTAETVFMYVIRTGEAPGQVT